MTLTPTILLFPHIYMHLFLLSEYALVSHLAYCCIVAGVHFQVGLSSVDTGVAAGLTRGFVIVGGPVS